MSDVRKDVGIVTAYGYAVEGGYQGTEAQYTELMGSIANIAQEATDAKTAAETAQGKAEDAQEAAETAQGKAEDAQEAAERAQGLADDAKSAANDSATSASESVLKAEGFAVGEQNEVEVGSDSPYYHNNAKYYSEEAGDSATQAAASAATSAAMTGLAPQFDSTKAYSAGDYVLYSGTLYQFTSAHAAGAWTGTDATAVTLAPEVTDLKSQIEQIPENGTAANAKQLLSTQGITDEVPYLFRRSGGDGADREFDTVVGGTVAWNQLVRNPVGSDTRDGITLSWDADGLVTLSGQSSKTSGYINFSITGKGVDLVKDHVYFVNSVLKQDTGTTQMSAVGLFFGNGGSIQTSSKNGGIVKQTGDITGNSTCYIRPYYTFDGTLAYYLSLFDLTQMFGNSIAEYLYSLEQSTPDAGVAWFRELFPLDYYPYDAGTLKSVGGVSAHEMVGFNAWDEETERVTIDWNTHIYTPDASGGRLASKNYIPVIPGEEYYINLTNGVACSGYVDAEGHGGRGITPNSSTHLFTIPDDVHFMKFGVMASSYGTTYKHDICFNRSCSRNGQYEPYVKHSYPLDSDLTLRGIPKLDANNNLYYDGDEYAADGTVTRKYGIVDMGTLTWTLGGGGVQFYVLMPTAKNVNGANAICPKYINHGPLVGGWASLADKEFSISGQQLRIYDASYSDAATFKSAMSGVYLVYELATPTTEEADPYQSPQILSEYGTESYVVTERSGVAVPVGHSTRYPMNQVKKLDGLPSNFSTLIAPTEAAMNATRNYTVNQFLIVNNQLYKVTSNIASGGTLTPNSNITATTIGEVLTALLNA